MDKILYNDSYYVYFNGDIQNAITGKIYSKNKTNGRGYHNFYCSKQKKNLYIHRVVALCFISNPNNYKEVNHIDGNKSNNSASNLEWCNRSINNKHAYKTGLRALSKEAHSKLIEFALKKTKKKVIDTKTGDIYESIKEAAIKNNIQFNTLAAMLSGQNSNRTTLIYLKDYQP